MGILFAKGVASTVGAAILPGAHDEVDIHEWARAAGWAVVDDGWCPRIVRQASGAARAVVCYFHGNLGTAREAAALPAGDAVRVVSFEYPGYGHARRVPTVAAFEDWLPHMAVCVADQAKRPERLVLHGRSLGGTCAMYVAQRLEVHAIVLESCFVSALETRLPRAVADMLRQAEGVFDNRERVAAMRGFQRLVVLHGDDDRVVPVRDAKHIAVAAMQGSRTRNVQLVIVPRGGHSVMATQHARDVWVDTVMGL